MASTLRASGLVREFDGGIPISSAEAEAGEA